MSPSPAVALIVVLLPACNRPVDEGLGDLGEGGIVPPTTTDLDTGAQEESAGPADDDVPRDVGTDEDASTGEDAPASMCGNAMIEGDEDCDGDELALQTCMTWGFLAGDLACNDDCTIDTSACLSEAVCGDGTISGDEDCESTTDQTCTSLELGSGELVCAKDCRYDASGCSCRGAGQSCYIDWAMPGGRSNCCPPGFKGVVQGACGAGSGTCS